MTYRKQNGNTSQVEKQIGLEGGSPTRKYAIAFNGPPRVGKDTASNAVCSLIRDRAPWLQIRHLKLSDPLKKAVHALYSAFHNPDFYDIPENAALKELPTGDFLGMSPREAYISLSEKYMKKIDPQFLGFIARRNMARMQGARVFVFSDGGFAEEWCPIVDYIGAENFMLVEIHAAAIDFNNDSRGYIGDELKIKYPEMKLIKLNNVFGDASDRELFRTFAQGAAMNFLRHEIRDDEG